MDLKSKIILIAGPTACGKSNFALKLSKKINGEIINADSMQVYKQLQILTARPKKKDLKKIKHHLYGFFDVRKNYNLQRVELIGLYWHFVDIVWIFLFPILYIANF